ncbi:amidase [uncultured Roseobacter sp.]|uniref:amidase family protein n=1 Tax=uncultured Roseobacter sp. TaxID=114847 RepID=UPI0026318BA8|nr:amidase [uncultured Roseobacter sp.]
MTQNALLALDTIPSLAEIARQIADTQHRIEHYLELTRRRDAVERIVNAFELRDETCPIEVRGPLNGLPISIKDQIAVAGWPRSFGLERCTKKVDDRSASLVTRLQALGAVVTGKTALPPHAMDFQTANVRRGPTRNPHDPAFTTGGSTGGGAAAVASGMSLLDVGADLSGSLRIPAAWCGVASYTPTEGLWPNDGLLPGKNCLDHFARFGLTARSVADLNTVWRLLEPSAGPEPKRATQPTVGVWSPADQSPVDEDTLIAWREVETRLNAGGFQTETDSMGQLFDADVYRVGGEMIGYETGALIPWLIRWMMRRDKRAADQSKGFIRHIHKGYRRSTDRHMECLEFLANHRTSAEASFERLDALLLPVTAICAFRHILPVRDQGGVRSYDTVFETGAGPLGYFDALTQFTLPITVLGWPVVILRLGQDGNGLPIGAQLVGKPGADVQLLSLAAQLEAVLFQPVVPSE